MMLSLYSATSVSIHCAVAFLCDNNNILIISISISILTDCVWTAACAVNINGDLGNPQPLYLHYHSADLVRTSNGRSFFYLDADERIDLFCSDGFKPPISGDRRKTLTASCISGNRFDINGRSETLRTVRCNQNVYSDTRPTKRTCVTGNTVEIGYNVEGKTGWSKD